jgi:hypothetical protein
MRATVPAMQVAGVADCRVFYQANGSAGDASAQQPAAAATGYTPLDQQAGFDASGDSSGMMPWATCNIEQVNDALFQDAPVKVTQDKDLLLVGWIVAPTDATPEYQLAFENQDDHARVQTPVKLSLSRPDVAAVYKQSTNILGFRLHVRNGDLSPGNYRTYLLANTDKGSFVCDKGRKLELTVN